MSQDITSMQLYPRAERVLKDIEAAGYGAGELPLDVLTRYDQLHYHGTEALDAAIQACGMKDGEEVLEVGAGWGGCARYLAKTSGAYVTAVELQEPYHRIGSDLTQQTGLASHVAHVNADFLDLDLAQGVFDHAVSWLALFHIPRRSDYLAKISASLKPGAMFFAEDLYSLARPDPSEAEDFNQNLFPNSLVEIDEYQSTLADAGFEILQLDDMTDDWTEFTATRLAAFRKTRTEYEAVHGAEGYRALEVFYDKMAGYFERGLVGGVRFAARRL